MYMPAHFEEPRVPVLQAFMQRHPLAMLVAVVSGEPDAMHVPVLVDTAAGALGSIRGHIARANPMWRQLADGAGVLVVFRGADAYVSPGWYPSKREHGRVVPTWNYEVVHARGSIRWIHDAAWLRPLVGALTDRHEAGRAKAWRLEDAPGDYIERMLQSIVGFEVAVARLEGKMKLSQNRSQADREGVVAGLAEAGDPASAGMSALVAEAVATTPGRPRGD